MNKFTTPVAMRCDTDAQAKSAENILHELGYRFNTDYVPDRPYICTKYGGDVDNFGFASKPAATLRDRTIISFNLPLFKALAAMQEVGFHEGEMVVCLINNISVDHNEYGGQFKCGSIYEVHNTSASYVNVKADETGKMNGMNPKHFRKATAQEIISHFTEQEEHQAEQEEKPAKQELPGEGWKTNDFVVCLKQSEQPAFTQGRIYCIRTIENKDGRLRAMIQYDDNGSTTNGMWADRFRKATPEEVAAFLERKRTPANAVKPAGGERAISDEEYNQRGLAVSHYPSKWSSAKRMSLPADYWDKVRLTYLELGGLADCQLHDNGNTPLSKDQLAALGIKEPTRVPPTPQPVEPTGFYVFVEGQNTPRYIHPTFATAHSEAERLAGMSHGNRVFVCAIYATITVPKPEIRHTYAKGVQAPEMTDDMPF